MENNKNALIAVMTAAIVAMTLSAATLMLAISIQGRVKYVQESAAAIASQLSGLAAETTADTSFLVQEYNGVIGIFDSTGMLCDIINVDVKGLPEADRVMLGAGIWTSSRSELAALIEDYTD